MRVPSGNIRTLRQLSPEDALSVAWHLAKGSYGTAKSNGIVLENSDPAMSDEMKHLAANFLRISELLVEAGFRP